LKEKEILNLLKKTIKNSYSPYSHYKVAAVIETKSGKLYSGANVENSSFGLTICAERVAAVCAIKDGEREFKRIYVMTEEDIPPIPCGACLQFLAEFNPDLEIVSFGKKGKKTTTLSKVLVSSFHLRKK